MCEQAKRGCETHAQATRTESLQESVSERLSEFDAIGWSVRRVHLLAGTHALCGCYPSGGSSAAVHCKVCVIAAAFLSRHVVGARGVAVATGTARCARSINERGAADLQHVLTSVAAIVRFRQGHVLASVLCNAFAFASSHGRE